MNADFNIDNYTIEDLISIFDIDIIMSKGQLTAYITKMIKEYKQDDNKGANNYIEFFTQALNRLLLNYDEMIQIIKNNEPHDNTHAENILIMIPCGIHFFIFKSNIFPIKKHLSKGYLVNNCKKIKIQLNEPNNHFLGSITTCA